MLPYYNWMWYEAALSSVWVQFDWYEPLSLKLNVIHYITFTTHIKLMQQSNWTHLTLNSIVRLRLVWLQNRFNKHYQQVNMYSKQSQISIVIVFLNKVYSFRSFSYIRIVVYKEHQTQNKINLLHWQGSGWCVILRFLAMCEFWTCWTAFDETR
jgi:hypothetical protein